MIKGSGAVRVGEVGTRGTNERMIQTVRPTGGGAKRAVTFLFDSPQSRGLPRRGGGSQRVLGGRRQPFIARTASALGFPACLGTLSFDGAVIGEHLLDEGGAGLRVLFSRRALLGLAVVTFLVQVQLVLGMENFPTVHSAAGERLVVLRLVVVELEGLVEDLAAAGEHAPGLEERVRLPVQEELRVGQEAGLAVQLDAYVGPCAAVDLQVIVQVGDVDEVPAAVLADHLLALHLQEGLGLIVVPVSSNVRQQIFEKLEAPSALANRAHVVVAVVRFAPGRLGWSPPTRAPVLIPGGHARLNFVNSLGL